MQEHIHNLIITIRIFFGIFIRCPLRIINLCYFPSPQGRTETHFGAPWYSVNICSTLILKGRGETDFLSAFTFRQLCKESSVETRGNWHHIQDLFQW